MFTILEKIRKLLALGERAGTEAEAQAAMRAAHRLLAEHNLDLEQVQSATGAVEEDITTDDSTQAGLRSTDAADMIYQKISELYFCNVFFEIHKLAGVRKYCIMGKRSNIVVVKHIVAYVIKTMDTLARQEGNYAAQDALYKGKTLDKRLWRIDFKLGFAKRIAERVDKEIALAKENRCTTGDDRALALQSLYEKEALAIADYKKREYGKFNRCHNTAYIKNDEAYRAGFDTAANTYLSANVIDGQKPAKKIGSFF